MLNKLRDEVYQNAVYKGFNIIGKKPDIPCKLMLIVSELSEAMEAHRSGNYKQNVLEIIKKDFPIDIILQKEFFESNVKDTFEDELADVVIRVLELAGCLDIDIEAHVKAKIKYNTSRPIKHGKKY